MAVNLPANLAATASRRAVRQANNVEIVVARTLDDLMQVMAVRTVVYLAEQHCPYDEEYDGNDFAGATHLLLRRDGEPVGTLRLRWFADFAKIERVAVRPDHRGRQDTLALVDAAFRLAERKGYRHIIGHAQSRLLPFWKRRFNAVPREDRARFAFSDYDYVEIIAEVNPPDNAMSLETDPMVLLRPEGDWDRPGVLDRSATRAATGGRSATAN
jgi:predicted GNAT family N-acyltransferase